MMARRLIATILALAFLLPAQALPQNISRLMERQLQRGDEDLNSPVISSSVREKQKSKFLALGLSLLLPGAGQYYTENKSRMVIFASAEGAIWTGFFGLRAYGSWKKEDYKAWAAFHAGANVNGKPDLFYEKMTYYDNLNEYNQFAPLYDGSDAHLFPSTPEYWWNWDSDANRSHYRVLRNQSKNAYQRSLFLLGAALANRILAGIDAYRSASAYDRNREFASADWGLYYAADGPLWDSRLEIGFVKKF
jgi:hypothetical protein